MSGFRLKIPECEALPSLKNKLEKQQQWQVFFFLDPETADMTSHHGRTIFFVVVAVIPEDTPGKTSSTGLDFCLCRPASFLSLCSFKTHADAYSPVWMHTAASIHFKWPVFQCDKCAGHMSFYLVRLGGWVLCQNRSLGIFVVVYALLKGIYFS